MLGLLLRRAGFSLLSLMLVTSLPVHPDPRDTGQPGADRAWAGRDQAQLTQFEHDHGLDRPVVGAIRRLGRRRRPARRPGTLLHHRPTGRAGYPRHAAGNPGTRCHRLPVFLPAVDPGRHGLGPAARYRAGLRRPPRRRAGRFHPRLLARPGADHGPGGGPRLVPARRRRALVRRRGRPPEFDRPADLLPRHLLHGRAQPHDPLQPCWTCWGRTTCEPPAPPAWHAGAC